MEKIFLFKDGGLPFTSQVSRGLSTGHVRYMDEVAAELSYSAGYRGTCCLFSSCVEEAGSAFKIIICDASQNSLLGRPYFIKYPGGCVDDH